MAKKAYLVEVNFLTRVIIESKAGKRAFSNTEMNDLATKAGENIIVRINNGETRENIVDIREDKECPYGTFKEDSWR